MAATPRRRRARWPFTGTAHVFAIAEAGELPVIVEADLLTPPVNAVGSAAFAVSRASIGTAAAQIAAARTGRIAATLYNAGSATVYFGASDVTTAAGMPLPANASATIETQAAIYGIAASGTQAIGVMETF